MGSGYQRILRAFPRKFAQKRNGSGKKEYGRKNRRSLPQLRETDGHKARVGLESLYCSGFKECKTAKPVKDASKQIGMKCPKCAEFSPDDQGEIVMKKTRKGRVFTAVPDTPNATTPLGKTLRKKSGNGSVGFFHKHQINSFLFTYLS